MRELKKIPARIHVIIAKEANQAIVIRRRPSKRTAIYKWNMDANTLELGQWLKGKLFPYRSDISFDGEHGIYFAMASKRYETYTYVAKVPYLHILDFYLKGDAWNGGGLFLEHQKYWLNEVNTQSHDKQRKESSFEVLHEDTSPMGENFPIYHRRLERDNWVCIKNKSERWQTILTYHKAISDKEVLIKTFYGTLTRKVGRGSYYEEHVILSKDTDEGIDCSTWQ